MRPVRLDPSAGVAALLVLVALAAIARSRANTAVEAEEPRVPAVPVEPVAPTTPAARALRDGEPLDVNAASAGDLELLPGIGPALAGRIVAHREEHGPFATVDALTDVRGIGPRTVERLRALVRAGPPHASGR